jgi:hypothetical protein
MKRLVWILVVLMLASPALAAKKLSVQQLRDLLVSLQQAKKTDAEVATELTQVELTEELTRSAMNDFADYVPGPLTSVQMYVLEAHSAVLPPPATDLPTTPTPDAATQKAILDKAIEYATNTYAQLPHLTAAKTTLRFEEEWPKIPSAVTQTASLNKLFDLDERQLGHVIRFVNSAEIPVDLQNGAEQDILAADKTHWGENGQTALLGQGPVLANVVKEAQATGKIDWLRWETVNGKQAAVFAFTVGKKQSHYAVNYCCFRNAKTHGMQPMHSSFLSEHSSSFDISSWDSLKITVPYHGEIFVDPKNGIIVRLVNQAEFKPTENVRQEDQRIDYAPVTVGANTLVLPVRTIVSSVTINTKAVARRVGRGSSVPKCSPKAVTPSFSANTRTINQPVRRKNDEQGSIFILYCHALRSMCTIAGIPASAGSIS